MSALNNKIRNFPFICRNIWSSSLSLSHTLDCKFPEGTEPRWDVKLAPFLMPFDLYCVFVSCIIQKHLPSSVVLQKKVNKALVLRPNCEVLVCPFIHLYQHKLMSFCFIQWAIIHNSHYLMLKLFYKFKNVAWRIIHKLLWL